MAKISFTDIVTGFFSVTKLNDNFNKIKDELNNKVLYRNNPTGEPNQMENEIDMNSNKIINLGKPVNDNDAVRLQEVKDIANEATTASYVSYDNSTSGLSATDVQAAIDEVDTAVDNVTTPDASNVSYDSSGSDLSSSNVKDALDELDDDIDTAVDAHANLTNNPHSVNKNQVGLANVPNENYRNRTITTGDGLSGGGDLSADRTFTVDGTVLRDTDLAANGGTVPETDRSNTFESSQKVKGPLTLAAAVGGVEGGEIQFEADPDQADQADWIFDVSADIFRFRRSGSSTGEWRFYHLGLIAGYPTGGTQGEGTLNAEELYENGNRVVESGSNSDGEWVRFADGTQICYKQDFNLTAGVQTSVLNGTWTYPTSFGGDGSKIARMASFNAASGMSPSSNDIGLTRHWDSGDSLTNGVIYQYVISGGTDFSAGNSIAISVMAIGKWY